MNDFQLLRKYFPEVKVAYYGLTTLMAAFLQKLPGYPLILRGLTQLDRALLSRPAIQPYAWQVLIEFKKPTTL